MKNTEFDTHWQEVVGMEDTHTLMADFAFVAADTIIDKVRDGRTFTLATVLNGGMTFLTYLYAALTVRLHEGDIDKSVFDTIANSTAIFETPKNDDGVRTVVTSKIYTESNVNNPITPQEIILVDDIFETAAVTKAVASLFPDLPLTLIAPIIKECTENNLEDLNYSLIYGQKVANAYIDTGCGMNGGIYFTDIPKYEWPDIELMQRMASIGYWHDPADTEVKNLGTIHRQRLESEQLPWTYLIHNEAEPLLYLPSYYKYLQDIEALKLHGHTDYQLDLGESILDTLQTLSPIQGYCILTSSLFETETDLPEPV